MRKLIFNNKIQQGTDGFRALPFCALYGFHAQLQVVADHGDELAIASAVLPPNTLQAGNLQEA